MDAAAEAAVHFHQLPVLCDHRHHPALVDTAAIAAEKGFFFHNQSSTAQKPMGPTVSQSGATVCILCASRI